MHRFGVQLNRSFLLLVAGAALTACGGGGSGTGGTGTGAAGTPMVTGVAATGAAISGGSVTLKCSTGTTSAVTTNADGSYAIDVSKVTLPCVARVEYSDTTTGKLVRLHSLVRTTGTVNITPLTDSLVATLSSTGVAANVYDDDKEVAKVKDFTDQRVSTAAQAVKIYYKNFDSTLDTSKIPDDLIGAKLVAKSKSHSGDEQDGALDSIQASLDKHGKTHDDVEHEMRNGHHGGLSTSTGQPGDAVAGKKVYDETCLSCHGPRMPEALNSAHIMNAITKNEGGMGSLKGIITQTMADNIATYLANPGSGTPPVTVLKTQTITFVTPGSQTMGVTVPALTATSTSSLPVTITSTTPAVCTVSGNTLTLVAPGSCSLDAKQTGNAVYSGAPTVTNTFTVASAAGIPLKAQTITFVSPGNQTMGVATPTLTATATSNLPVTITSTTPAVCTVVTNTLTLVAPGGCSLRANQGGDATYSVAPTLTNAFTVASAAGIPLKAQTITFAMPAAQTMGVATPALTASASSGLAVTLSSTTPTVCTVSGSALTLVAAGNCTITANQAGDASFAVAPTVTNTFVVNPAPITPPVVVPSAINGKALYVSNSCGMCHGTPPSMANILIGANNPTAIQAAITNVGSMSSFANKFTTSNLADIAAYLATPTI